VFDVVVVWFSVCDQALDGAREPDQMSLLPGGDQLVTVCGHGERFGDHSQIKQPMITAADSLQFDS